MAKNHRKILFFSYRVENANVAVKIPFCLAIRIMTPFTAKLRSPG